MSPSWRCATSSKTTTTEPGQMSVCPSLLCKGASVERWQPGCQRCLNYLLRDAVIDFNTTR